jgi:hypothetical protein
MKTIIDMFKVQGLMFEKLFQTSLSNQLWTLNFEP